MQAEVYVMSPLREQAGPFNSWNWQDEAPFKDKHQQGKEPAENRIQVQQERVAGACGKLNNDPKDSQILKPGKEPVNVTLFAKRNFAAVGDYPVLSSGP